MKDTSAKNFNFNLNLNIKIIRTRYQYQYQYCRTHNSISISIPIPKTIKFKLNLNLKTIPKKFEPVSRNYGLGPSARQARFFVEFYQFAYTIYFINWTGKAPLCVPLVLS